MHCRLQCSFQRCSDKRAQIPNGKANKHPELRDRTIWEVFEEERPRLVPYIGPFDGFHAVPASVSTTCLVRFDKNRYSVDARAVGRPVEIRAYADRLECWQDGQIVGRHEGAFGRDDARPGWIWMFTRSCPDRHNSQHKSRLIMTSGHPVNYTTLTDVTNVSRAHCSTGSHTTSTSWR